MSTGYAQARAKGHHLTQGILLSQSAHMKILYFLIIFAKYGSGLFPALLPERLAKESVAASLKYYDLPAFKAFEGDGEFLTVILQTFAQILSGRGLQGRLTALRQGKNSLGGCG